jgi:hypothetical protein
VIDRLQAGQADRSSAARVDLSGLTVDDAYAHLFPTGRPGLTDDAEVVPMYESSMNRKARLTGHLAGVLE